METTVNKGMKPLAPPAPSQAGAWHQTACTLKALQRDFSCVSPSSSSLLSLPQQHTAAVPHGQGRRQPGAGQAGALTAAPLTTKGLQGMHRAAGTGRSALRCSGRGDKMAASAVGGKRTWCPLAGCSLPSGVRGQPWPHRAGTGHGAGAQM